jgi:hypothetical protein
MAHMSDMGFAKRSIHNKEQLVSRKKWVQSLLLFVSSHATYGVIVGGGGDDIPPLGGGKGVLPSVVFPPSVIFPPCANAGASTDTPPTDVATAPKAAAATKNVAQILLFMFECIGES